MFSSRKYPSAHWRLARTGLVAALMVHMWLSTGTVSSAQQTTLEDEFNRQVSADELNREIATLIYYGQFSEALPLAQRALSAAEARFGTSHPAFALSLDMLAEVYRNLGRYADAEPLYKSSLTVLENAFGPDHWSVAGPLSNLAVMYMDIGREKDAEPLLKRAIAILDKTLDPDSVAAAVTRDYSALGRVVLRYGNLGKVINALGEDYRRLERYAEAVPLYERSLAIADALYGPDNVSSAQALSNLGLVQFLQGHYAVAELHFKRSVEVLEQAVGSDSPELATALQNLASLYLSQGRYSDADLMSKRTLAIWDKALGPTNPHVMKALNLQAASYLAQGRNAEALAIMRRAMS